MESGEIQDVAYVCSFKDAVTSNGFSIDRPAAILGALRILEHDIINDFELCR